MLAPLYRTQGLIDGREAAKTATVKGLGLLLTPASFFKRGGIKMCLAGELFINGLLSR